MYKFTETEYETFDSLRDRLAMAFMAGSATDNNKKIVNIVEYSYQAADLAIIERAKETKLKKEAKKSYGKYYD